MRSIGLIGKYFLKALVIKDLEGADYLYFVPIEKKDTNKLISVFLSIVVFCILKKRNG